MDAVGGLFQHMTLLTQTGIQPILELRLEVVL